MVQDARFHRTIVVGAMIEKIRREVGFASHISCRSPLLVASLSREYFGAGSGTEVL
jgi:hypothetical protein